MLGGVKGLLDQLPLRLDLVGIKAKRAPPTVLRQRQKLALPTNALSPCMLALSSAAIEACQRSCTNLSVRAFKGLLPTQWRPLSAVGGVLLRPLMVAADNVASSASVAVLASWPSSWRFFGRMIAKAISASAIHCSGRQMRWRDRPR